MTGQVALRHRRLLEGRRIGTTQLFLPLFLVHFRVGDSEQLIERRLVNHGHFGNPDAQGKPEVPRG